jgi:hypothetical protein
MDKKTKRIIVPFLILVVGLVLLLAVKDASKPTKIFSIKAITTTTPNDPTWATAPCTEDLHDAFNQKFTYLALGGQCFVFLSEDRRYVLKFFRQAKFSKPLIGDGEKRLRKKQRTFESCKLAYEQMKEETGLILLHLVANDGFQHRVTLIDQNKKTHTIELGEFEFLLQKAASPLLCALEQMKDKGDLESAKEIIDKLFLFIERRHALKVVDFDPAIPTNFGLIEGRICQFDVGRFYALKTQEQLLRELKEFGKKNWIFASWLEQNYPELYPYYLEKRDSLADLIAGGTG